MWMESERDKKKKSKEKCQKDEGCCTFVVLASALGVSTFVSLHPARRKRKSAWSMSYTCVASILLMRVSPEHFPGARTEHISQSIKLPWVMWCALCWYSWATEPACQHGDVVDETRNAWLTPFYLLSFSHDINTRAAPTSSSQLVAFRHANCQTI